MLKGKYGCGLVEGGFLVAKPTDSFIWNGVVSAWDILAKHEAWARRDGTMVDAWRDTWFPGNIQLGDWVHEVHDDMLNWRVCDMVDRAGNWNL